MKTLLCKILLMPLLLSLLVGCTISIDLSSQPTAEVVVPAPPQPTEAPPAPTAAPPGPIIPAGWSTYRNDAVGFEISYPATYSALDDANNLYGWTNGVVLLYNSGQSYDIAIQLWNSQTEYENEFSGQMERITVYPIGNQFLTIMDVTQEPENPGVIATFHRIE